MAKPPVARKLDVRHTSFVCLTASLQANGGLKFLLFQNACMVYVYIQACLFKYITVAPFMLSGKVQVGCRALNCNGNCIVDHGKSWNSVFEYLWEP